MSAATNYTRLCLCLKTPFRLPFRHLLGNFRIMGEAQAIDRVIEKFAARWFEDNPDSIFTSADAAYMFAYAIMMLATDLHRYLC